MTALPKWEYEPFTQPENRSDETSELLRKIVGLQQGNQDVSPNSEISTFSIRPDNTTSYYFLGSSMLIPGADVSFEIDLKNTAFIMPLSFQGLFWPSPVLVNTFANAPKRNISILLPLLPFDNKDPVALDRVSAHIFLMKKIHENLREALESVRCSEAKIELKPDWSHEYDAGKDVRIVVKVSSHFSEEIEQRFWEKISESLDFIKQRTPEEWEFLIQHISVELKFPELITP